MVQKTDDSNFSMQNKVSSGIRTCLVLRKGNSFSAVKSIVTHLMGHSYEAIISHRDGFSSRALYERPDESVSPSLTKWGISCSTENSGFPVFPMI